MQANFAGDAQYKQHLDGPIHRKALAKAEAQRQRDLQLGASKGAAESALVLTSHAHGMQDCDTACMLNASEPPAINSHNPSLDVEGLLSLNEASVTPASGICDAHLRCQAAAAWANGGVLSARRQASHAPAPRPPAQNAATAPQPGCEGSQGGMYANKGSTGVSGRLGGRKDGPGSYSG